jgi:hypothetical protein
MEGGRERVGERVGKRDGGRRDSGLHCLRAHALSRWGTRMRLLQSMLTSSSPVFPPCLFFAHL